MSARVDVFALNKGELRKYLNSLPDEELMPALDEIFDQLDREFESVMSDLRALTAHHHPTPTLH